MWETYGYLPVAPTNYFSKAKLPSEDRSRQQYLVNNFSPEKRSTYGVSACISHSMHYKYYNRIFGLLLASFRLETLRNLLYWSKLIKTALNSRFSWISIYYQSMREDFTRWGSLTRKISQILSNPILLLTSRANAGLKTSNSLLLFWELNMFFIVKSHIGEPSEACIYSVLCQTRGYIEAFIH